jgi:lysosomal acid lipase/cholesteryl ester hydrolase
MDLQAETQNKNHPKRQVVFLQHGIADSADAFIIPNSSHDPLAIMLVKEGYDVWLGNSRGSKYSLKHANYDYRKDSEYWDFSFPEMSLDIKASITEVLERTERDKDQKSKLTFIGHS